MIRGLALIRNITIQRQLKPLLIRLTNRRLRSSQSLINFLANARKPAACTLVVSLRTSCSLHQLVRICQLSQITRSIFSIFNGSFSLCRGGYVRLFIVVSIKDVLIVIDDSNIGLELLLCIRQPSLLYLSNRKRSTSICDRRLLLPLYGYRSFLPVYMRHRFLSV